MGYTLKYNLPTLVTPEMEKMWAEAKFSILYKIVKCPLGIPAYEYLPVDTVTGEITTRFLAGKTM